MANFTGSMYGQLPLHLMNKRINLVSDDIRARLMASSYTPNKDTHDFADDLTGELATAGGYTSGGVALANKTVTYDAATDTTKFDADDVTIASSTLTWRTAVFTDNSPGTAATNPLISYQQGDADTISSGGNTTLTMPATGILLFTV